MTERLETVLGKVLTISNPVNSSLIQEFYQFMAVLHVKIRMLESLEL
jgi:hypothetical protein